MKKGLWDKATDAEKNKLQDTFIGRVEIMIVDRPN